MSNRVHATAQSVARGTDHDTERPPTRSRLLLVRHGESTWNRARRIQGQLDPPLSDRGLTQARELAERLSGRSLAGFYCSDLARAQQTAEALVDAVGLEPTPEVGLREIMLGAWEGKTRDELEAEFPEEWAAWMRRPSWDLVPGGEGEAPFADRVTATLGEIRARHPGGDVLCVTHGGVIQVGILEVVGRGSGGFFPFMIENCSLTVIQRRNGRAVVTSVNDTCHLSSAAMRATELSN
ncbi:MAG TPA: histidine phosphatase family protein [Candidatus Dormibacteraeota bacterium]|nr:histidine phosphatase family protein [Candidatus Dormibacteraeota bacterium]